MADDDGKKIGDTGGKVIDIGISDEERAKRRAVLDKASGDALRKQFNDESRLEIEAAEKQLNPPIITEPRCSVCTSQWRQFIERELVKGASYSEIARNLPPESNGKKVERRAIGHHAKEHMATMQTAIRAELEEQANLLRQNVEVGAKGALTNKGVLQVIVRKAYDDFLNGVITAEVRDIIQLVKLVNEMETNSATIRNEESEATVRIFLKAIQNICNAEIQGEIQAEVRRLREMDRIEYEMENQLSPPKMIEAQVVDEGTRTESND